MLQGKRWDKQACYNVKKKPLVSSFALLNSFSKCLYKYLSTFGKEHVV